MALAARAVQQAILTTIVVLSSSLAIQPRNDTKPDSGLESNVMPWKGECIEFSTSITIKAGENEYKVPLDAHLKDNCDEDVTFIIYWQDKRLSFFLKLEGNPHRMYRLDEIHFEEGNKTWCVMDVKWLRGVIDGELVCSQTKTLQLNDCSNNSATTFLSPDADALKASPKIFNMNKVLFFREGEAPADLDSNNDTEFSSAGLNNPESSTARGRPEINTSESTDTANGPIAGSASPLPENDGVTLDTNNGESSGVNFEEDDLSQRQIELVLSQFSLTYKKTLGLDDAQKYVSSCRIKPDISVVLIVSGAVTTAVLVVAVGIALRMF